jgi:hypothetical protein
MKPPPRGNRYFWTTYFIIMVTAGWLLWWEQRTAMRAMTQLVERKQERARLARRSPALSRDNEMALDQEVAVAAEELAEMQAGLQATVRRLLAPPPPANSIEAFVELATFKERLRLGAAQAGVRLKPDEHFGFATHATEGPGADAIPEVHRQRLAVQILIETLWNSGPGSLLAVRRERPKSDPSDSQQSRTQDFFEIPATMSLREKGQVEAESFRLEFTGHTKTLRGLLNKLASSKQPFVVRSVEVEPVSVVSPANSADASVSGTSLAPLTKQNASRFSVTLELILWAGAAAHNSG